MGHTRSTARHLLFAASIAVTSPGCAFVFASGAPDTPVTAQNAAEIVADPPCTQSAAWAWVDVVFVGAYGGVATASTMEAIEIGLAEAIGLFVGSAAHAVSAIIGFGRSGSCYAYMASARSAATAPPGSVAVTGQITEATPGFNATFTMQQVAALQRGVQTSEQLRQQFGEPQSRVPINPPSPDGCVEVWTWMRGMSALSVAFGPDGTVCKVATAGPTPQ